MRDVLGRLASANRERVRSLRGRSADLMDRADRSPRPRPLALSGRGFDVIAEVKPASPSAGPLVPGGHGAIEACARRARRYAGAGACAISVLTEPSVFGGSLDLLATVAGAADLPVMRKDVLVDPLQVAEARASGASGVLLIARVLEGGALAEMLSASHALGLFAVVEAFDRVDFDRAARAADSAPGTALLGVNARDLATLEVDLERFDALAGLIPSAIPVIAESGIATREAAARVAALGYRGALIGEALMRPADPRPGLAAMIEAGREAAGRGEVRR